MAAAGRLFIANLAPFVMAACLFCAPLASGQQRGGTQGPQSPAQQTTGSITINVRLPDGSPADQSLLVNLYAFSGASAGIGRVRGGRADFTNLPLGRYTAEIFAPGYEKLVEQVDVSMAGQTTQAFLTLKPETSGTNPAAQSTAGPILAPNAQKELNKALDALRTDKLEEAKKHLEKTSKAAPTNPDVDYVWGMYYLQSKDLARAKSSWEKAVQIYPRHAFSLAALSQLALIDGDVPGAIDYLSRAVEAAPSSWRFQERLAAAYLRHQEYEQAQNHAERAIEFGKDRASDAQLILAKALIQRNNPQRALKALDTYLAEQPSGPGAPEAQRLSASLRQPAAAAVAPTAPPPDPPVNQAASQPTKGALASVAEDLVPPSKWMPPDIDESMPAVEAGVACPLEQIQNETGKRVHDFIDAVNRISATESLDNEVIDRFGFPTHHESRNFSYVASVQEIRPGMYDVEEYRNGSAGLDVFPEHIATIGLPSLVMIFHPNYRTDFDVSCEGLSRWHGGLAWQLHFRQRPDKPSRLREYSVGGQNFPVSLRGRAWVAVDTFQVVSLETDIVSPVPEIRLKAEHTSIEYMPVKFQSHHQELWLPESAELFFDYEGRRMHRRHHFRNYLLFSVDEKQKISTPDVDSQSDPDPVGPHSD